MHRSARTAHTMRPSRSGSSTMQSATGQAAWQIEHANAPKQRSGSITAMVLGAFLRGPLIILVHIVDRLCRMSRRAPPEREWLYLRRCPLGGPPTSGMTAKSVVVSSKICAFALVAKYRRFEADRGSAAALNAAPAAPTPSPLQDPGAPGNGAAVIWTV